MNQETIQQLVTFRVEDELFGLPVMDVNEIILPTEMQRITSRMKYVVGVVVLRGEVISILDFRILLQKEPLERSKKQRIIILSHQERTLGLLVDEVSQVMPIKDMELDAAPKSTIPYVFGICKQIGTNTIIYMLETEKLSKEAEGDMDAT